MRSLKKIPFHSVRYFLGGLIVTVSLNCSKLPNEKIIFDPPPAGDELVHIPSQPGIDGIVITGPKKILPVFRIIPMRSGRVIDFAMLGSNVNIEITAEIDGDGHLIITHQKDAGFPDAAKYISAAMAGWTYTNFKIGIIKFWFDMASEGRRLKIDKSGLRINAAITSLNSLPDGKLHMIDGLRPGDLGYVKF